MADKPLAVQRQLEAADALRRQAYGDEGAEDSRAASQGAAPADTPAPGTEPRSEVTTDAAATPAGDAETTPTGDAATAPTLTAKTGREDDIDYWRSRAATLFGINQQMANDLKAVKSQALAAIDAAQKARNARSAPDLQPETADNKDAETFGEDLIAAIDRRAADIAKVSIAKEREAFQRYIKELEGRLGAVDKSIAATAEDRFYNALERAVPDYETINASQEFLDWLAHVDPVYRTSRQTALSVAEKHLDADAVISVFREFKAASGATAPAAATPAAVKPSNELNRQISPSAAPGAAPTTNAGGRLWTEREFREALDPRQRLHLGVEKAAQMKDAANKAFAEGRVRWG
jgi:hypothetical protein